MVKDVLVWAVIVLVMAYNAHWILERLDAYLMMNEFDTMVFPELESCEANYEPRAAFDSLCDRTCLNQAHDILAVAERIAVHPGATVRQREVAVLRLLNWRDVGWQEARCIRHLME